MLCPIVCVGISFVDSVGRVEMIMNTALSKALHLSLRPRRRSAADGRKLSDHTSRVGPLQASFRQHDRGSVFASNLFVQLIVMLPSETPKASGHKESSQDGVTTKKPILLSRPKFHRVSPLLAFFSPSRV